MSGRTGMRKRTPLGADQARSRMWQSMRVLRRFSSADMQATAEVSPNHSQKYLRGLLDAGYLRLLQPRQSGYTGGHAVYQLIRDTGPHAPRIGKQGLRDPNLEAHERLPSAQPITITRGEYQRAMCCVRACAGIADPETEVAQLRAGARQ